MSNFSNLFSRKRIRLDVFGIDHSSLLQMIQMEKYHLINLLKVINLLKFLTLKVVSV